MKTIPNLKDCQDILLQTLYQAIEDKQCFYRYHIPDKEKDEEGNTRAVIREHISDKIDLKALKECIDILESLQKQSGEGESKNQGVIILSDLQTLLKEKGEQHGTYTKIK